MSIDVAPIRAAEFPVTREFIYLNHAGVSPIPARSAEAGAADFATTRDEGALRLRRWEETTKSARANFAEIVGASSEEVALVGSTSEGLSFVAAGFPWKEGDNVVLSNIEYPSNVYPWLRLRSRGVEVRMVAARDGRIRKEDLFAACDGKTRVLSLSSVEFANGFRNDLPGIGEYCQHHGIFFCVDGIQSLGVIPMDVKSYGIDALAADGHKWLLGPGGAGGFYISKDVMEMVEPVILGWHSVEERFDFEHYHLKLSPDARRYEPGSHNTPGLAAFAASMRLLLDTGVDRIWERVRRLTDDVVHKAQTAGFELVTPLHPEERSGIVTIRVPGSDPLTLWKHLLNRKCVTAFRAGGIRISPHFYNTPDEIDRFFEIIEEERKA